MTSYVNEYFGSQQTTLQSASNATLKLTDGSLTVDFTQSSSGWYLFGNNGWGPVIAQLSSTYGNSAIADGEFLKHSKFTNVNESFQVGLNFNSTDNLITEVNKLSELLEKRAPAYWSDRRNNQPVYFEIKMPGETKSSYIYVQEGHIVLPTDFWDVTCTLNNGNAFPIQVSFTRLPFKYGASPGQAQDTVAMSALQDWNYNLLFSEETTLPTGQVFAFGETSSGDIYAGGASEILKWNGTSWAAETTTPVTLSADVTAVLVLANGDILFGESGRIIKLSSGTYSVETSLPAGQVWALIEATDSSVFAADNAQILKRDVNGTWAVDDTLPGGQVWSLSQSDTGRVFAGEANGRILRQKDALESDNIEVEVVDYRDDAEENTSGATNITNAWLNFFDSTKQTAIGIRFQNITIPQGATINSAQIRFECRTYDSGQTGTTRIYCEDIDDSTLFAATTNNITNRTLTTAYAEWSTNQTWVPGGMYTSADFSVALQEVVNRSGWASGNSAAVIFNTPGGGDRDAYTIGHGGAPPTLIVTYTEARAGGTNWEVSTTQPTGNVRTLLCPTCGGLLAGADGEIWSSDDDGVSWGLVSTLPTNEVRGLHEVGEISGGENVIFAGDNGNILRSNDCGANWAVESTLPTSYPYDFIKETATGDVRAGDDGRILILSDGDSLSLGRSETETGEIFIANHHKTANLTHVFQYDDDLAAYANLFPGASFPFSIYPASSAVGDIIYFIINTALDDTGPFNNLVFDIATPASATTSYTIVWEYYNGAWTTLTVQDGTSQFSEPGVKSVHWKQPSDWTTVTINSITGYAVRARLSALTGTFTTPTQQNRDIYSAISNFSDISTTEIKGNVEAIAKFNLRNRSAAGGPGGSEPTLYATRLLMGLKEYVGYEDFRAFLNFADEQNPDGVTVDVTVDTDSATAIQDDSTVATPTGRVVFFDATSATLDTMSDRAALKLSTTIAQNYYGFYKAFLRCRQSGGSAGNVKVRLKVVSGTGGISLLTETRPTRSTTDHELIEFEQSINIPVSSLLSSSEVGDEISITVQIETSSATADLYLYDLFLLPTDDAGMWVDIVDTANSANSAIDDGTRLIADSITIPKVIMRGLVQNVGAGTFKSTYRTDSNGPIILLNGKRHRLWVLLARKNSAGGTVWLSEPEACLSIRGWKTERWLLGRGIA